MLGATTEVLWANIGWNSSFLFTCQRGQFDPKFQVEGVASTNNALYKTRLNDLSYGIKISAYISFILSHFTHLRDRRMDRHLSHSQNVSKLNEVWQNYCRNRMVQYFSCDMEEFISRYCLFRVDNQTVVMIAGISVIRRSTGRVDQHVFSFVCVQLIIRWWSWSGCRVD